MLATNDVPDDPHYPHHTDCITQVNQNRAKRGRMHPEGSRWRRWDLHVHTPYSYLTPCFTGLAMDEYVQALDSAAVQENISVIGVTDYLSIEGYKDLLARKNDTANPVLRSVDLLIPNIEFRIGLQTDRGYSLNIHILVDPTDPEHVEKIERALGNLKFRFGNDGDLFGCSQLELERFGRALGVSGSSKDAIKHATTQFKPDWSTFIAWWDQDSWLRRSSFIAVSNRSDGTGGLQDGGFSALKKEILRRSHFVFSSNPADREHFLGRKSGVPESQIIENYGGLKPCIHGSDAHQVEQLFKPDLERRCFIRANPTFEGLRQVTHEPGERVMIGTAHPVKADASRVIERISIRNDNNWFSDMEIPLNEGVVAIIGEKGAGKTALAELIAFGAGVSAELQSKTSFIAKAKRLLSGVEVEVTWKSGERTIGRLPQHPPQIVEPLVRYLSQDFVERLCNSVDRASDELQEAIEGVVFSKLDVEKREGYSNFSDLHRAKQANSQRRRDEIQGKLAANHRESVRVQTEFGRLAEKMQLLNETKAHLQSLTTQLPEAAEGSSKDLLDQRSAAQQERAEIQHKIDTLGQRARVYRDALDSYERLKVHFVNELKEIVNSLENADPDLHKSGTSVLSLMTPDWGTGVEPFLNERVEDWSREIDLLKGSADQSTSDKRSVFDLNLEIDAIDAKLSKIETSNQHAIDLQNQIAEAQAKSTSQSLEIRRLEEEAPKEIQRLKDERLSLYEAFLNELEIERSYLDELYAPMADELDRLGSDASTKVRFSLSAGIEVDREGWLQEFNGMLDARRSGYTEMRTKVADFVSREFSDAIEAWDTSAVVSTVDGLEDLVDPVATKFSLGNSTTTAEHLFEWVYRTSHFQVNYTVNYDGMQLHNLSPGTRGIALLVLYLLMDSDDRRPLIVDQPEGNLDSSSVYDQLVPYIRAARAQRQVILVTHNPNLVIGTDADQVVVATALRDNGRVHPSIRYVTGALEQTGLEGELDVREHVCLVLEGGRQAFVERENRYSLGKK